MSPNPQEDLIVLTPGKDETAAFRAMLSRPRALGIRRISVEFQQHPDRDPGCRLRARDFLQRESGRFRHALVVFDHHGCGAEDRSPDELEAGVARSLANAGWGDRAAAVVIVPELEVWIWNNTAHVETTLGWTGHDPTLLAWLAQEDFLEEGASKPKRPKEAVERALRTVGKRRSSAIYAQLATRVSLARCTDPAFIKLRLILQRWFAEK